MTRLPNAIGRLRRLRWLPRMLLATVVLAWAQAAWLPCVMAAQTAAPMADHCVYCPPAQHGGDRMAGACNYPQGPTVDVAVAATLHFSSLLGSGIVQPHSFDPFDSRFNQDCRPPDRWHAPPQRPLNLTHCVQLK